jgi:NAD(P)-dependent dehydrogenase (short-subunit alcohol dehydrogenase family)
MDVHGNVAIVTGAGAEGTGRAIALELGRLGAAVVAADIDPAGGQQTVDRIGELGGRAAFVRADMRVSDDIPEMIRFAEGTFGSLDILVNNAGNTWEPHFPQASAEHWGAALDLNLRGPMLATQLALQPMRRRGAGSIVNMSSVAGLGLRPHASPEYSAAKAGLIRFTATLAPLAERLGVRVNCVVPEWIRTAEVLREIEAMSDHDRAVLPRLLEPEEVAAAVVQLIGDDSLAGRVMVMWCDEEPRLLDAGRRE